MGEWETGWCLQAPPRAQTLCHAPDKGGRENAAVSIAKHQRSHDCLRPRLARKNLPHRVEGLAERAKVLVPVGDAAGGDGGHADGGVLRHVPREVRVVRGRVVVPFPSIIPTDRVLERRQATVDFVRGTTIRAHLLLRASPLGVRLAIPKSCHPRRRAVLNIVGGRRLVPWSVPSVSALPGDVRQASGAAGDLFWGRLIIAHLWHAVLRKELDGEDRIDRHEDHHDQKGLGDSRHRPRK